MICDGWKLDFSSRDLLVDAFFDGDGGAGRSKEGAGLDAELPTSFESLLDSNASSCFVESGFEEPSAKSARGSMVPFPANVRFTGGGPRLLFLAGDGEVAKSKRWRAATA